MVIVTGGGTGIGAAVTRAFAAHGDDVVVCQRTAADAETARAALAHADVLQRDVEDIKAQRDRIVTEISALGLFPAVSDSNFVTFGGLADPHAAFEALLADGIIVRDNGLPGHLRVTAGTQEETTAFLTSLRRYVGRHPEALTGHP